MYDGFIKAAAITPKVRVADVNFNCSRINEKAREAADRGAKLIVFPELSITGCSCADLFLQPLLIARALQGLKDIAADTDWIEALIFVGLPLEVNSKLYDAAAVIYKGEVLAFIPKRSIPDHGENSGSRYFARGNAEPVNIGFNGKDVPFGQNIMFTIPAVTGIQIAVEIGDDMYAPNTPATRHALNGANVIVNLAAECECIGRNAVRQTKVMDNSSRLICGYIFANAGYGESTTDLVYNGHNLIAENGEILCEGEGCGITCTDLDVERIRLERRRVNTFDMVDFADYTKNMEHYITVPVDMECRETKLDRVFEADPFVPACEIKRKERCAEILKIQTLGLARRLEHVKADKALIGLSGGLDSTLSLLVTGKAFDVLGRDHKDIIAVTMPCFGTSDRTYNNACTLAKCLGAELGEIRIDKAITQHFEDISHSMDEKNSAYENAQARERTQVLMDIANDVNGLVIGTGDMSELALGWATFNGDHMAMYGTNAGIPKTLVRAVVEYYAGDCRDASLKAALHDILSTPVSPELLPPKDGQIAQKTEELVGPYKLHDFFIYYMLRRGFSPRKIYRIACNVFKDEFDEEEILKWEKNFMSRFFSQQFKRNCMPEGPKVGSVDLSSRGGLHMPSDAVAYVWLDELDEI